MAVRIFEMSAASSGSARAVPWRARQSISATASPQQSSAFSSATNSITVQCDEVVHVSFGENPAADTSDMKLQPGIDYDFFVVPGNKLSVRTA